MILRARIVVTMDGPPIENGAVAVSGNRIIDVGTFEDIRARNSDEVIDLGEQALLPGLINAHCHLEYTGLRGQLASPSSFTDWIRAINAAKAKLLPEDYVRSINDGFANAKRFGTTTIANLTAFPELIRKIDEPIRTWWFAELINIRNPQESKKLVEEALRLLPKSSEGIGLAPHAPYTASADLYRGCEEVAERRGVLLTTHLAESKDEMMMCFDLGGPLADFLASISPDLFEYTGTTPVATLSEFCRLDERWLLVHVNEILDSDINLLRNTHIVHCPRSHAYFGHTRFEFAKLHTRGINICLGTDSLASNDDLSLFAEMREFQKRFSDVASEEILSMVTVKGARALGQESSVGRIRAGCLADLIAIPCESGRDVFEQIIAFDRPVPWLMIDGGAAGTL